MGIPFHDDVIKWKHFPCNWPFVWELRWSPMKSPHKVHWRGALEFSLIIAWTNGLINNRDAGDLRLCRAHYDVTVMSFPAFPTTDTVHILVSDTYYGTVSPVERDQMATCVVLPAPVPTKREIERPCAPGVIGQYLYVVLVLESADKGDLQIYEMRVYSSTYRNND